MLDRYWFGEVDRISPEAPVPIVAVRETDERLGGAANVVRNMTALGSQAGLLAVLGRDEAATCVRHLLAESAIAAHLHEDNRLATTVKLRILGRRQQMLCADFESLPDRDMLLEHLGNYRCLLGKYDLIVLSDYGKGGLDLPGFFGPMISGKMALRQRGADEEESIYRRADGRDPAGSGSQLRGRGGPEEQGQRTDRLQLA